MNRWTPESSTIDPLLKHQHSSYQATEAIVKSKQTYPKDGAPADTETPPQFLDIDPENVKRVQDAVADAGLSACGIMGIDVWMVNDEDQKLYHFGQQGMNWVNPVYKRQLEGDVGPNHEREERLEELHRLTDRTNPHYYHPFPQPSGVGLAGNYWQQYGDLAGSASSFNEPLVWRRVKAFTSDPDQMPYERMFAIEKAFGKCTGVPFNVFGEYKGVVVFFARGTAQERIINSQTNSGFIRLASYNIASTLATSYGKVKSMRSRRELSTRCFRKAKIAFATVGILKSIPSKGYRKPTLKDQLASFKDSLRPLGESQSKSFRERLTDVKKTAISAKEYLKRKAHHVKSKSTKPPDLKPPPPANFITSLWSFVGCFTILAVLFGIHLAVEGISDGKYSLVLPPFGALMALQFSLTAAPASQPRNSFLGLTVSFIMVMLNKLLMHHIFGLPQWFHASLGTSLAVFTMQKTGVTHPPAGAAAFVIALSHKDVNTDLILIGLVLLADVVAIGLAVIMNNLSDTRQYPMYWKFLPFGSNRKTS